MEVRGYVATTNFVSGFIWIVLLLLFAYLFAEHHLRKKFPQNLILFLLLCDTALRCMWFFLSVNSKSELYTVLINRMAILLQFTAISLLMLMWLRALQITRLTYDLSHRYHEQHQNAQKGIQSAPVDEATIRYEAQEKEKFRIRLAVFCNVATWCFILGTCAIGSDNWYDANIIMISVLCLAEAVITLTIGLKTSLMLQKELAPVFLANNVNITSDTKSRNLGWFQSAKDFCGCSDLYSLYLLFFSKTESALGLQLQRDVLKTLLHVTLVIFVFFLIRSFAFMYRPTADDLADGRGYNPNVADTMYPLFYYQFPESIPNLAIALGISPPNSILRRAIALVRRVLCCTKPQAFPQFNANESGTTFEPQPSLSRFTDAFLYSQDANSLVQSTTSEVVKSEEEERRKRRAANIAAPHYPSKAPTNFRRTSADQQHQLSSSVPSLSPLHEETPKDLRKEQQPSLPQSEHVEEDLSPPLESISSGVPEIASPTLSEAANNSSGDVRESKRSSFNIAMPIPIPKGQTRSRMSSNEYDIDYADSDIEKSPSAPSAVQTSSGPSSKPLSARSGWAGTSPLSDPNAYYMYNTPIGPQLGREMSSERNKSDYQEFLYRINSIGDYPEQARSGDFETGEGSRFSASRKKRQSSDGGALVEANRAAQPKSNAMKWNWYSQFW